jgi:hypothetical protein
MPYDAAKDFAAITQMVRVPNVLVMNAARAEQLKIHSLADLIAYASANPGKLNYGSGGNGSAGHLAGEMFKQKAGIYALHIPTAAPTRRSWRCWPARWTSTSTTWLPPRPTSRRQAQGAGRDLAGRQPHAARRAAAVESFPVLPSTPGGAWWRPPARPSR